MYFMGTWPAAQAGVVWKTNHGLQSLISPLLLLLWVIATPFMWCLSQKCWTSGKGQKLGTASFSPGIHALPKSQQFWSYGRKMSVSLSCLSGLHLLLIHWINAKCDGSWAAASGLDLLLLKGSRSKLSGLYHLCCWREWPLHTAQRGCVCPHRLPPNQLAAPGSQFQGSGNLSSFKSTVVFGREGKSWLYFTRVPRHLPGTMLHQILGHAGDSQGPWASPCSGHTGSCGARAP